MKLGENIAALRRERGLTQEQLGQLVGISAQAVSKWENGGAPDPELLPSIADRLGVTIDSLYGRSRERTPCMEEALDRWLTALPQEKRLTELFRVLAKTFQSFYMTEGSALSGLKSALLDAMPSPSAYTQELAAVSESTWLRALLRSEEGLILAVLAKDFPFYLLMPEPEQGYAANFGDNGDYRRLFSALAVPGALECLQMLYAHKHSYYTAAAIAKHTGLEPGAVSPILNGLTEAHLLVRRALETEDGEITVYETNDNSGFPAFLCLARWLMEPDDMWSICWYFRNTPLLRTPDREDKTK